MVLVPLLRREHLGLGHSPYSNANLVLVGDHKDPSARGRNCTKNVFQVFMLLTEVTGLCELAILEVRSALSDHSESDLIIIPFMFRNLNSKSLKA